jgi:hypothetical protein
VRRPTDLPSPAICAGRHGPAAAADMAMSPARSSTVPIAGWMAADTMSDVF